MSRLRPTNSGEPGSYDQHEARGSNLAADSHCLTPPQRSAASACRPLLARVVSLGGGRWVVSVDVYRGVFAGAGIIYVGALGFWD